jgi:hypothetical protein
MMLTYNLRVVIYYCFVKNCLSVNQLIEQHTNFKFHSKMYKIRCRLPGACSLLGSLFDHEDRSSMFLWNISEILQDYIAVYLRR